MDSIIQKTDLKKSLINDLNNIVCEYFNQKIIFQGKDNVKLITYEDKEYKNEYKNKDKHKITDIFEATIHVGLSTKIIIWYNYFITNLEMLISLGINKSGPLDDFTADISPEDLTQVGLIQYLKEAFEKSTLMLMKSPMITIK